MACVPHVREVPFPKVHDFAHRTLDIDRGTNLEAVINLVVAVVVAVVVVTLRNIVRAGEIRLDIHDF